jgi:predicted transposase YbfD/YdcC
VGDPAVVDDRERRRLCLTLPDAQVSVAQERSGKARHGRKEIRTLWALSSAVLNAYVGSSGTAEQPWPGVAQVCRLQRVVESKDQATKTWQTTVELAYAITSTAPTEADAELLLKRWRAQWQVENGLHWVRDVTFGEDASLIFKGQAPLVFAVLRNSALPLLTTLNKPSLAAAMRHLGSQSSALLTLFTNLFEQLACRPQQSGP